MTELTTTTIKLAEIIDNIKNGQIFTATFIKKNGDTRIMNCRKGVAKHTQGGSLSFNPKERGLIGVYDLQAKGYRFINSKTLTGIKYKGIMHKVAKWINYFQNSLKITTVFI